MYILQYFLIHRLVSFSFFRVGRFEVRFLGQKWRFGRFRFIPSLFQHYCTDEGKRACILVPICLSKLLEPAKMATGCSKQLGKINWDWYMRSLSLVSALLPAVVQTTSNTILVYQSHPYIQVPMMNVQLEFWKAWWPIFWIEYFLEFIAK